MTTCVSGAIATCVPRRLKLYPCSLIAGTELHEIWLQGGYQPYDHETLVDLLADCKAATPRYCRLDRVIRDIPATYVVVGNQHANLREMAKARLRESDHGLPVHPLPARSAAMP